MMGARKITSGIGILTGGSRTHTGCGRRVGGDAIDLALLGAAFKSKKSNRNKLAIATAAVAGRRLLTRSALSGQQAATATAKFA